MPSPDSVALALLLISAPAVTLFPLLYGLFLPWYHDNIGRALMVTSVGLAGLVDVSLAYRLFGADYNARDPLRLLVFAFITIGMWMLLVAMVRTIRGRIEPEDES